MSATDRVVGTLAELCALVERSGTMFLRYSDGPEADRRDGPSRDYESGEVMSGWSVTSLSPEPWWTRPLADWVARRVCKYMDLQQRADRRPWLLQARIVGRGTDHEPLVDELRFVAWLHDDALDEAARVYHARFAVGRDSAGDAEDSEPAGRRPA